MSDIELLREAARLMRERATAGNPSPWARPKLAGAVADWLESEASIHAELIATAVGVQVTTGGRWRLRLDGSTLPQAVAVARAYLGTDA